jgi:hypothetical protein
MGSLVLELRQILGSSRVGGGGGRSELRHATIASQIFELFENEPLFVPLAVDDTTSLQSVVHVVFASSMEHGQREEVS